MTLGALADALGGRLVGDASTLIDQVATLSGATSGRISFLAHAKYAAQLKQTAASAVLLRAADSAHCNVAHIIVDDPYVAFARVSQLLNPQQPTQKGVHPSAVIAADAIIHPSCRIDPHVVVSSGAVLHEGVWIGSGSHVGENVTLGAHTRLYPNVVIYAGCQLGERVVLHANVVIGADGFGIANEAGVWIKIPQIGGVRIGDDVEVGASTTIDRGAIEDTVIEEGVKLDNQIQIGHNCFVGAHTAMAGCVAVAGSARIGRHCSIGAAALILGHLEIADHTRISAATVVSRSIHTAGTYTGLFPMDEHVAWTKNAAHLRRLAQYADRVQDLETRLAKLEKTHG